MAAKSYMVINGPMPTTAAPASVTTGTAIKTMLQVVPASNTPIRVIEWGISFDGTTSSNTPIKCELLSTGAIAATVTAFVAADVMKYGDPNAPTEASNVPLQLGTALSGYTASAEGTITAVKEFDLQLVSPVNSYVKQFPLGREPEIAGGEILRVRVTAGTAVNAYCYVIFEV